MEANIECESMIRLLEKEVEILENGNKELDQQLEAKKAELEKAKEELDAEEESMYCDGIQRRKLKGSRR